MNKVSIAIPIYNRWHLTHQILFDIYKNCDNIHEIIIVNDNSPEKEVRDGMDWWLSQKMLPIQEIVLAENVMFLRASNIGMKQCAGDIVITVSNDVRIQSDITTRIRDMLRENPEQMIGGRLLDWDTGWNSFGGQVFPYIEGWLMATTKQGWEEIGYFDERFYPSDMEDIDSSTTALTLGYTLTPLNDERIQHIGAQSIGYNPKREAQTKLNKEKFRKKWKLP